jgi:hypothetical protein
MAPRPTLVGLEKSTNRARVSEGRRGGLEIDEEMGPVRGPMGVPEVGDDTGRGHQVQIVLGVIEHFRGREKVLHAFEGLGVAEERVEPDAVVDRCVLDLPVPPVIVAEGPPLHLPRRSVGMGWQGPDGPRQGCGPVGRTVHRAPLGCPQQVAHAADDEVGGGPHVGGGEAAEAPQGVEGPDIAHDGEEVRQGRHAVRIVGPELDRRLGIGGPIISVGQQNLLGPGRVFGLLLRLIEVGVDHGHFEEAAGRPIAENVDRVEVPAPAGQELLLVGEGPIRRSPGVGEVAAARGGPQRRSHEDGEEDGGGERSRTTPSRENAGHGHAPLGWCFFSTILTAVLPMPPRRDAGASLVL